MAGALDIVVMNAGEACDYCHRQRVMAEASMVPTAAFGFQTAVVSAWDRRQWCAIHLPERLRRKAT